jgi:hypothetical protein
MYVSQRESGFIFDSEDRCIEYLQGALGCGGCSKNYTRLGFDEDNGYVLCFNMCSQNDDWNGCVREEENTRKVLLKMLKEEDIFVGDILL